MKYLKQFMLILSFAFAGETLKYVLPFPIPASIYGFALLSAALESGVVRLRSVKDTAGYLIEIMPLLFIPAGVGLLDSWSGLKAMLIPSAVVIMVSTVIVMAVSGRVTQYVIRKDKKIEK